jgi:hypothetical protein
MLDGLPAKVPVAEKDTKAPQGEIAIPELCRMLGAHWNSEEYSQAVNALSHLDRTQALPQLLQLFQSQEDPRLRKGAARALGKLGKGASAEVFDPLVQRLDAKTDWIVLEGVVDALYDLSDTRAIEPLVRLYNSGLNIELRRNIARVLGELGEGAVADLIQLFNKEQEAKVRIMVVKALGRTGGAQVPEFLGNVLSRELEPTVRVRAVDGLGQIGGPEALRLLCRALVTETDYSVQSKLATVLKTLGTWQERVSQFVESCRASHVQRAGMNEKLFIEALSPSEEELADNRFLLPDTLIEQARDQDERVSSILAQLIIASAGDSRLAGERLSVYEKKHGLAPDALNRLRIEMGGTAALQPLIGPREQQGLETYFQIPVQRLNDRTQAQWENTIKFAQWGFVLRMVMSVGVFVGGCILLWASSVKILSGELDQAKLWGPGISFVSGLGSMLLIIYTGPLKEIRRSIMDLGASSAAFIAYVHRVLQVSHTFSLYYLRASVTLEDVNKSCQLINNSMRDTIEMLKETGEKPADSSNKQP